MAFKLTELMQNLFCLGWIPKSGVLTESMWKNVCRNFDQLQELESKHFKIADFKHSAYSGYRHRKLTKEINEWRECIRQSQFLNKKEFLMDPLMENN